MNFRAIPIILLAIIVVGIPIFSRLFLEYEWFVSLGYPQVFLIGLKTKLVLFVICTLFSFALFYAVWILNKRKVLATTKWVNPVFVDVYREEVGPEAKEVLNKAYPLYVAGAFAISVFIGMGVMEHWDTFLKYIYQTPFGMTDPIFGRDISFYIFSLPMYHIALNYIGAVFFIAIILTVLLFAFTNWRLVMDSQMVPFHLRMLYTILSFALAIKLYLYHYDILYSPAGVVYGAGYIDVHVNQYIPIAISVVLGISGIAALVSVLWKVPPERETKILSRRAVLIPVLTVIAIILISFLGGAVSAIVQAYKVSPNELVLEEPYIENNIEMTNFAYDLIKINEEQYNVEGSLNESVVYSPSIQNARLWDYRPLHTTYQQRQAIRTYYGFNTMEVDRYNILGEYTQVWIAVRELYQELIGAETWINRHLIYTHGFGVVMSPVNEVESEEGGPVLYIKDIPPRSIVDINVSQPRIYYGEKTDTYIITNTLRPEFDYPYGDKNVQTFYNGTGGIPLNTLNRMIATIALGDIKILLSDYVLPSSRLHIHRNVVDRVSNIAPYLMYDPDPHVFLDSEGRVKWMVHMFVYSDRYPYSEPSYGTKMNYIRDSVKAIVDAYNGTVEFYVINEDPVLQTYMKIYPDVFRPYEEMPDDYRAHLRYSERLFRLQADIYRNYHMKDPVVFYNKEDRWAFPLEKFEDDVKTVEPYNVVLLLPGYEKVNFVMMIPFTPINKNNMIAWMAVNQDPPSYGDLIVYKFPKDKLIYGPFQIDARIDQDEEISKSLTLWSQAGSTVIRGNLLVIPINDSIIYIEPLYIAAEEGSLPELKKVIVVYGNKVAMEDTLEEAVYVAVSGQTQLERVSGEMTLESLLNELISSYEKAKEELLKGDLEGYAKEMKRVDSIIGEISSRFE